MYDDLSEECRQRHLRHLRILHSGERLAGEVAAALADTMPEPRLCRAYRRQALDEQRHALLFQERILALGGELPALDAIPELEAYAGTLRAGARGGTPVTAVVGLNLVLEGLTAVGFAASARYVDARQDDVAWVHLLRTVERDERRHMRLLEPALRAIGGGAIPAEAGEAFAELRRLAITTLRHFTQEFGAWSLDPVALLDAALRAAHPSLSAAHGDR